MSNIDLSWVFWAAVLLLFTESWGRAWVRTRHVGGSAEGATGEGALDATCCCDARVAC